MDKKAIRAFAKAENIIILAFIREFLSGENIAVAVKTEKGCNGDYYTFGRIYDYGNNSFSYWQQGCASFTDGKEVRRHAYNYFGFK